MYNLFDNKTVLITGGTGSLGKAMLEKILTFDYGKPAKIKIFSRDENKQYEMKKKHNKFVEYIIGDIRNFDSIAMAVKGVDIVIHAAALKHVPVGEEFPFEMVQTNVLGAMNLIHAVNMWGNDKVVVGISTDKACKPVNAMGMSKALMEKLFAADRGGNSFLCVRYGNVISSRGSVIPFFKECKEQGRKLPVTDKDMTRFLLSLDRATDTIIFALCHRLKGTISVPKIKACSIYELAKSISDDVEVTKIRPGEKIHEILVSEEELVRTEDMGGYFVIYPTLFACDLRGMAKEYSSIDNCVDTTFFKKEL